MRLSIGRAFNLPFTLAYKILLRLDFVNTTSYFSLCCSSVVLCVCICILPALTAGGGFYQV